MDQSVGAAHPIHAATIHGWLERGAALHPDKVFVRSLDQGRQITYGEALRLARRMARYLAARGFRANDRVALLSENSLEHLMVYYGVMYFGATICTIHVEMNAVVTVRVDIRKGMAALMGNWPRFESNRAGVLAELQPSQFVATEGVPVKPAGIVIGPTSEPGSIPTRTALAFAATLSTKES